MSRPYFPNLTLLSILVIATLAVGCAGRERLSPGLLTWISASPETTQSTPIAQRDQVQPQVQDFGHSAPRNPGFPAHPIVERSSQRRRAVSLMGIEPHQNNHSRAYVGQTIRQVAGQGHLEDLLQRENPPTAPAPPPALLPGSVENRETFSIPLRSKSSEDNIQLETVGDRISLSVRDGILSTVLSIIAERHGLNIVTSSDLNIPLSVTLHDVTVDQALNAILRSANCTWHSEGNIVYVSSVHTESHINPAIQGREVRVFRLDYVSATDIEKVVRGLLSPVGNIFASESDSANNRRTIDSVVVEDLPAYMRRIEQYIHQIDQPPRQVLIEAHILEVRLSDSTTHGVNFDYLATLCDTKLRLETSGANPLASSGLLFSIEGSKLTSLIEALQVTNDAKTLASPKVLALNGQEAKIQIGERLGFFVTTTTQTATLQQVEFVDVGVLLRVTPQVTADNRVIMTVQPEISTGQVNETTGLPDKATTEVATSVILDNGRGIIIGGLIQETDSDRQSKLPLIGDVWAAGRLFGRRQAVRERREIIVALIPRVVPYTCDEQIRDENEFSRASTPLLDESLKRYPRIEEGSLPDAMKDPRQIDLRRIPQAVPNLRDPYPLPPEYYMPANSERGIDDPNLRYDPRRVPVYYEPELPPIEYSYEGQQ